MSLVVVKLPDHACLSARRVVLHRYPLSWKMWLMLGQMEARNGNAAGAREAYTLGLRKCGSCVPLWAAAAATEEVTGNLYVCIPNTLNIPDLFIQDNERSLSQTHFARRVSQDQGTCALRTGPPQGGEKS
jgi:hypothetical protein